MSKNAPDTRNKLDNNKSNKPKRKPTVIKLTEIKRVIDQPGVVKLKAEKKPTKGQLFKKENGYSKTMKRNLKKADLSPNMIDIYKEKRKARKAKERKAKRIKRETSVTFKRLNGKKKGSKSQGKKKSSAETKSK
jgi:hypothetical protein